MAGKANQMEGGVKWASSLHVRMESQKVYHSDAKCSYLLRGTYTDYGGMALYPSKQPSKNDSQTEKTEHEVMLL